MVGLAIPLRPPTPPPPCHKKINFNFFQDLEDARVADASRQKQNSHKSQNLSAAELRDILKQHQRTEKYMRLLETRRQLPVYQYR